MITTAHRRQSPPLATPALDDEGDPDSGNLTLRRLSPALALMLASCSVLTAQADERRRSRALSNADPRADLRKTIANALPFVGNKSGVSCSGTSTLSTLPFSETSLRSGPSYDSPWRSLLFTIAMQGQSS